MQRGVDARSEQLNLSYEQSPTLGRHLTMLNPGCLKQLADPWRGSLRTIQKLVEVTVKPKLGSKCKFLSQVYPSRTPLRTELPQEPTSLREYSPKKMIWMLFQYQKIAGEPKKKAVNTKLRLFGVSTGTNWRVLSRITHWTGVTCGGTASRVV